MKQILKLEIEEALVERISPVTENGATVYLKNGLYIFVSNNHIGVFSEATIAGSEVDFSKIPTIDLTLMAPPDMEDFPDVTTTMQ